MNKKAKPVNHNKRLAIKLLIGVVVMFGFAYALVPLYRLVCSQTGINGRSATRDAIDPSAVIDRSRQVTVEFTTTIHGNLAFQFRPVTRRIDLHPGETKRVYFFAENDTGKTITAQAIPSIAPGEAAKYLKKTQCFCFTQQTFFKGEKVDMPVIFHVDPNIPKDIHYFTLNYTLFDASAFIKKQKHVVTGRIEL